VREIKFRGKTLKGEWIYGYLMNMHSDDRLFIGTWKNIGGEATVKDELFFSYKEVDPKTVGQYTGLKDSKGVEIYEGDIINYSNGFKIYEVKWNNNSHEFKLHDRNQKHNMEIIGNIYEHPELLPKTGKE